jgi:hypothetical protein
MATGSTRSIATARSLREFLARLATPIGCGAIERGATRPRRIGCNMNR